MTAKLKPSQKIEWAKSQRIEGNLLFEKKKYKEAIDVYLTCFVAMDKLFSPNPAATSEIGIEKSMTSSTSKSENSNKNKLNSEKYDNKKTTSNETIVTDMISKEEIEREIQLPVLLNLSLCTLNLGLLSKTEDFCNFALDLPCGIGKINPKVFFRRGKARMLMGNYHGSQNDLEYALKLLELDHSCDNIKEKEALQKALQKLQRLKKSAKINCQNQKKAMKYILGGVNKAQKRAIKNNQDVATTMKRNDILNERNTSNEDSGRLYHDMEKQWPHFSKIRAKSKGGKIQSHSLFPDDEQNIYHTTIEIKYGSILFIVFYITFVHLWKSRFDPQQL